MNCGLGAWAVSRSGGKGNTIGVLGSVGTNSPRDNERFPVATACPFTISCLGRRSASLSMHQLSTMLLSPKQDQTVSYPKDNTGRLQPIHSLVLT